MEIVSRFEHSFGGAVIYETITGRLHGEVIPTDAGNSIIVDLERAARSASGTVAYAADFVLLKPLDMRTSNGVLRYMAPNRGNRLETPDSLALADGTVFLWGAWQGDVLPGDQRLVLDIPIAVNDDGSAITGTVQVEFAGGLAGRSQATMPLQGNAFNRGQAPYPPFRSDNEGALLTQRVRASDPRRHIPNDRWTFATCDDDTPFPGTPDSSHVCLDGGFQPGILYELVYEARDPRVMGIGLAAVRDMVSFFRHADRDGAGTPNPVASSIRYAIGSGISQAGNFMKTFVHLGFNEDLAGRTVFDGLFPIVAARQTNIIMRFAVPGGGGGIRVDHRAPGQSSVRGFAPDYHDELRGATGGIFKRCTESDTCPLTMLALSGSELWVLQGSPGLTNALGTRDLDQPDDLRIYYFAGTQHGSAPTRWNPEATVYPTGVHATFDPILRALWKRLTEWVTGGTLPPPSQIPRLSDGTLVPPESLRYPRMQGVSFPVDSVPRTIPSFEYRGWYNALGLLDFGPRFEEPDERGIADWRPPAYMGRDYAILVSGVDADGNEIAGIQPVGNAVPLGTNLPYNYNADRALGDLYWLSGSFIPFHRSRAAREAAGDERRSLEERYGDNDGYVDAVRQAVAELVSDGFLLETDARRLIEEAEQRRPFD